MKKNILIYNPQCSKCLGVEKILREKGIPYEEIRYLSGELSEELLKQLPRVLKLPYEAMIRKSEDLYEELKLENKKLSDDEWVQLFLHYPVLLERPIFIRGERGLIARPSELVLELL